MVSCSHIWAGDVNPHFPVLLPHFMLTKVRLDTKWYIAAMSDFAFLDPHFQAAIEFESFTWSCLEACLFHYTAYFSQTQCRKLISALLLIPWDLFSFSGAEIYS